MSDICLGVFKYLLIDKGNIKVMYKLFEVNCISK